MAKRERGVGTSVVDAGVVPIQVDSDSESESWIECNCWNGANEDQARKIQRLHC